jgi:hypothetical protein
MNTAALPSHEPPVGAIVLRSISHFKSDSYSAGSDFGHTSQGYWYRMRDQRSSGCPLEALRHFLKLSMWDEHGRLWQCATPAVIDDFGNLVEVMS